MISRNDFIKRQSNKTLKTKLEMEKPFKDEIKKLFKKQVSELKKQNENVINSLNNIKKQYTRCLNVLIPEKKNDASNIKRKLLSYIDESSIRDATQINDTTENDIKKSLILARESLAEDGNTNPSEKTLYLVAANLLKSKLNSRVGTIVTTETQIAIEGMRNRIVNETHKILEDVIVDSDITRVKELNKISNDYTTYQITEKIGKVENIELFAMISQAKKIWFTVGDRRVRPWHNDADGQEVRIDDPFVVKNEYLMYPGDMSLGASGDNIIGCRCGAMY